jgi:3-methylfumaryl-CoA hydratase
VDPKDWIGRSETRHERIAPEPAAGFAATLDRHHFDAVAGTALPPLWHWLHFLPRHRASEVGVDGHAKRGGFLPPVELPRRMWAGGRFEFRAPLRIGDAATRTSRIVDVTGKQGRTGPLVFVKVEHSIATARGVAIVEEHDVVYREVAAASGEPPRARADEQFAREVVPDPVLLFRYSALTFNGHRIHYDHPYVTQVEGYPGLVVHGPLVATLLLDELQRRHPGASVARYAFRAVSPLFDTAPFTLCGRIDGAEATLWARGPTGALAIDAQATLA